MISSKQIVVMIFCTSVIYSCNPKSKIHTEFDYKLDEYYYFLIDGMEELTINSEITIDPTSQEIYLPRLPLIDRQGNLILVNGDVNSINLLNTKGELLDRVGKKGGGPEEFQGIMNTSLTNDTLIYAYDSRLTRVTRYSLSNNRFTFHGIVSNISGPEQGLSTSFTRNFYALRGKYYTVGFTPRPNRTVQLNRLGDNETGSVMIKEFPMHFPDIYLSNMQITNHGWSMGTDEFLYFYYDSLVVNRVFPSNATEQRFTLVDKHRDRYINSMNAAYLKEERDYEAISEMKLHTITEAVQNQNYLVVDITYYGGDRGLLLMYNTANNSSRFILTPPKFFLTGLQKNMIYGILVDQVEGNKIHLMNVDLF